jgi:hypothetical protein
VQNTQWGGDLRENSSNLGPKPIISSMKQVVKGDGQKTWKNTKLGRSFSYWYNYTLQDSGSLNILKNQKHSLPIK